MDNFVHGKKYRVVRPWADKDSAGLPKLKSLCYSVKVGDILKFRGPNLGRAEFLTEDGRLLILHKRTAFRIFSNIVQPPKNPKPRVVCSVCKRNYAGRVPKNGDGSSLFPRLHRQSSRMSIGGGYYHRGPDPVCPGSYEPAEEIKDLVEDDGYEAVCIHGVHYGGVNCWECHPEKLSSIDWLFSPEMDQAAAAYKKSIGDDSK